MADQSSTSGYGQQTPADWSGDHNAAQFLIRQALGRIATVRLAQVTAVHPGSGTPPIAGFVDVLPLVNQLDGAGNSTPHGTVFGLPYLRIQSGSNAVIVDPAVGDIGLVLVCDRDISAVKSAKKQANPGSRRRFNLADGVWLGGVLGAAPTQYVQFTANGIKIADKNGNSLESSAAGWTFVGNVIMQNNLQLGGALQAVDGATYAGALQTTGDVVAGVGGADQVGLLTHKHGGVQTGTGQSGSPTPGT